MNFNLMYSSGHINMGTSADDLFDKSGKNKNSLHYKYNQFLVSPYMPRKYNFPNVNRISRYSNQDSEFNEEKENHLDDSFGETEIYYPKPNNYNSIYTQKFSKKFRNYYNHPYYSNPTENYNYINPRYDNNYNNPIILNKQQPNINGVKTPEYQIKKEIQYQRTPNKYTSYKEYQNDNLMGHSDDEQNLQNNKYNNYKRFDDYYYPSYNRDQRLKSPKISKIAENNFLNQDLNKYKYSTPGIQDKRRRIYLEENNA